ncbi:zinc finger protein 668-like isoform X2 [Hyposmocoma kahamanoa]|uniref:zinc finger protein 668-like isoform X2 n=1 Tax=Hyposmocoma kahamanoa TaxID=1477025 RepID=UPI000E6D80D4|nr:zinc finger protein 668-like isoform X2 [Hyposmocoma kahamanoa]
MAATVLKIEADAAETCCVCGATGELFTPEEFDAGAPPMQLPLRAMLLHLNNNKVVPDGRLCGNCAQRAAEAYEFSTALSTRSAPPLSEKIRALRRRLHELTQKIDVFIVVGGPGAGSNNAYSEEDIIMVEKDALAAATAADDEDLEHAKNAKGDTVYQCSVCPMSFQRAAEYRAHLASHPSDALHSCWTCGAQFAHRQALHEHARDHQQLHHLSCHLCDTTFASQSELRRHEPACAARCPACAEEFLSRRELGAHAAAAHGRGAAPPLLCPLCFRAFRSADLLSAHALRHRQAKQFVCGYGDCVLRFATRGNLMAHIRKAHAAELPAEPAPAPAAAEVPCPRCDRTFASGAAMKRHARVHRGLDADRERPFRIEEIVEGAEGAEGDDMDGEVEYLEVETLEEAEEYDTKPDLAALQ